MSEVEKTLDHALIWAQAAIQDEEVGRLALPKEALALLADAAREVLALRAAEAERGTSLDWTGIVDPQAKEAARAEAYRALFTSSLGRLVLLDMLIEARVFGVRGPPSGIAGHTDYDAGERDRVVMIAELAGVDARHMAEALMTGNEGYLYDRPDELPELG